MGGLFVCAQTGQVAPRAFRADSYWKEASRRALRSAQAAKPGLAAPNLHVSHQNPCFSCSDPPNFPRNPTGTRFRPTKKSISPAHPPPPSHRLRHPAQALLLRKRKRGKSSFPRFARRPVPGLGNAAFKHLHVPSSPSRPFIPPNPLPPLICKAKLLYSQSPQNTPHFLPFSLL